MNPTLFRPEPFFARLARPSFRNQRGMPSENCPVRQEYVEYDLRDRKSTAVTLGRENLARDQTVRTVPVWDVSVWPFWGR
jgi:hypothetical protein